VLTHKQDALPVVLALLVVLGDDKGEPDMVKDKAAAFYSFNKGSSTQDYPGL